jgi:leader peptidase (prepilin peptidase)/N-methyltransferase
MRDIALPATFLGGGGLAGAAGRRLLSRLRRGTTLHSGWCEAAVAILWAVAGWRYATGHLPAWWLPIPLLLTWFAVLLAATDLRHLRLPDALTLPAYPVTAALVATAAVTGGGRTLALGAAIGALGYLALHAAVHLIRPTALGAGDVKLSGTLGAVLGATGLPSVIIATWLAATCTLALRLVPRRLAPHWHDAVPHGPGLLTATTVIALFPATL